MLAFGVLIIASLALRRPGATNPRFLPRFGAVTLCLLALASSPAIHDIVRFYGRGSSSSTDFASYYHKPRLVVTQHDRPKNLIYIYAESLEYTYFNETLFPGLVPNLRTVAQGAKVFTEVSQAEGTGWTMAGIVASQCGIPLVTPAGSMGGNSMSGMDVYLPGATAFSDLLKSKGYYLEFIGGADGAFAGKRKFLTTHSFDRILERRDLAAGRTDLTYESSWGAFDDTLFERALVEITSLSQHTPFALFLLTLDTHHPDGNPSAAVRHIKYRDGSNPMLNAVAGSDRLIGHFITELRKRPECRDTVIVVASDHLSMSTSAAPVLRNAHRTDLLLVEDGTGTGKTIDTPGTTFDIAPTIGPFLGFICDLGLGRNLQDQSIPLTERAQIASPSKLMSWERDIMQFWQFPRIQREIVVDAASKTLAIDTRIFRTPALVDIDEQLNAMLTFEFDASSNLQSLDYFMQRKPPGKPYLLVTTKNRARVLASASGAPEDLFLVIGRYGGGTDIHPISQRLKLTKAEVHKIVDQLR
jgi:phosphoglycerol transferase